MLCRFSIYHSQDSLQSPSLRLRRKQPSGYARFIRLYEYPYLLQDDSILQVVVHQLIDFGKTVIVQASHAARLRARAHQWNLGRDKQVERLRSGTNMKSQRGKMPSTTMVVQQSIISLTNVWLCAMWYIACLPITWMRLIIHLQQFHLAPAQGVVFAHMSENPIG